METAGWKRQGGTIIYIYIYIKNQVKRKIKEVKKMEKLRKEELAEKPSAIRIKTLRTERNMTQKEFGEWLDIPLQTIKQWELGLRSAPKWLLNLIEYRCDKATQGEQLEIETENKTLFIIEYQTIYAHSVSYDCFGSEKDRQQAIKCFFDKKELYKIIKLYECKKNSMGTIIRNF